MYLSYLILLGDMYIQYVSPLDFVQICLHLFIYLLIFHDFFAQDISRMD